MSDDRETMPMLVADAIGQFLAKLLGTDVDWYLAIVTPGSARVGVVSTIAPEQLAQLLKEQADRLEEDGPKELNTHWINTEEKPS